MPQGRLRQLPQVSPALAQWIEVLPVPVMLLDRKGRTLSMNQAWQDAATPGGLMSPSDARGADHVHDLRAGKGFSFRSAQELAQGIQAVLSQQQRHCTVLYETAHPEASWEAIVHALDDDPVCAVLVHLDRSGDVAADEHAAEAERLALELEAQQAWRKDQLRKVQRAMQETHGPLTPIRLRLHQLQTGLLGPLTDKQQRAISQIGANVEHWWQVQENLLASMQGDEGRRASDLRELVGDALPSLRDQALRAGVRLTAQGLGHPAPVFVAPDMVRQAIALLAEHAVRSTPAGGTVTIQLANGQGFCLTIRDGDGGNETPWPGLRLAAQVVEAQGGKLMHEADHRGRTVTVCFDRA